jgi:RNA polymerase sigma-70 factor (ECF subfamily)
VQEAFVRAVRDLDGFRGSGSLEGWLWRIVVNVARNHVRDRATAEELPGELPGNDGAIPENGRVRAAVLALPERQRTALFLRYYADLDYDSISEAMDVSPGTVGATLNAARAALRDRLVTKEKAR